MALRASRPWSQAGPARGKPTCGCADPFVVDGRTHGAYAEGMALQIGWDWCALGDWCAHKPREPVTEDLSCGLYRKAHHVCAATQDATELRQLLGCVTPGAQRCTPVECK